jgi:hypothetical protein
MSRIYMRVVVDNRSNATLRLKHFSTTGDWTPGGWAPDMPDLKVTSDRRRFPFRTRYPLSGKWYRARYKAERRRLSTPRNASQSMA